MGRQAPLGWRRAADDAAGGDCLGPQPAAHTTLIRRHHGGHRPSAARHDGHGAERIDDHSGPRRTAAFHRVADDGHHLPHDGYDLRDDGYHLPDDEHHVPDNDLDDDGPDGNADRADGHAG